MENEIKKQLDLTGVPCPFNFVKAKLALDELAPGELLELILDDGDAMLNVPRGLKEEGHTITKVTPLEDQYQLLVKKGLDT